MKSLIGLFERVAQDAATWCCTNADELRRSEVEIPRDLEYVTHRVDGEGLSFLTITLPTMRKDLELALSQGRISDNLWTGFSRVRRQGPPKFLGWLFRMVFDAESGILRSDASPDAIRAIRQLTGMFEKLLLPCSKGREERALDEYISVDEEVGRLDAVRNDDLRIALRRMSLRLFAPVFCHVDREIHSGALVGKHGPGVTADRLLGNQKWTNKTWTWRLEDAGLYSVDFLLPSSAHWRQAQKHNLLSPGEERPVKVVLVPKTLRTPRVIAVEPTAMQFAQQAISHAIQDAVDKLGPISRMVGIDDQDPNREMAHRGSSDGSLATLDLKEASDRVSNQHIEDLTFYWGLSRAAIQACRSLCAAVPGRGVIRLNKYASMGSALTFPLEAMVFLAIIFIGIERSLNRPLTRWDFEALSGRVRVFGDDIIVPSNHVLSVIQALEDFGLKVNSSKSFWNGKFRESCGKEYWDGHDVSIVKVRKLIPETRTDASAIISTVELRNHFYGFGYWRTAAHLDELINRLLNGWYPDVSETSRLLGRRSVLAGNQPVRELDPDLQVPVQRGYVVRAEVPVNAIDGVPALQKCLSPGRDLPFEDEQHLLRSGRPRAVGIKLVKAST